MKICISLPTQGDTTIKHPLPQQCARHMSIHSDLTPMEEGSHPRQGKGTTKEPPHRAGIKTHYPAAASETSGSSVTRPDLG